MRRPNSSSAAQVLDAQNPDNCQRVVEAAGISIADYGDTGFPRDSCLMGLAIAVNSGFV